jgi:pyruvate/2-oxoglutarate/acetoin dehydrogenase E1 component
LPLQDDKKDYMTTVLESLNSALHQAFTEDERVYLIGQDVLDPYGGAFKVAKGLSSKFPERVLPAPISEAGMVGIASGMAMRGLLPIVEIMFGDFLALAADQIINHLTKFRWMYNDQVRVPVVIRSPMGGRRGYGPTHSQTLEKLFLGLPGLSVLAPTNFGDPGILLKQAIFDEEDPILFIENKLLYLLPLFLSTESSEFTLDQPYDPSSNYPTYRLSLRGAPPPELTIVSYGYMANLAQQALLRLGYEFEIFSELIIFTQLSPFHISPLLDSIRTTGNLLTVEEGSLSMGWGAEIIARAADKHDLALTSTGRIASKDTPIPASVPCENTVLPGIEDIVHKARKMLEK